MFATITEWMIAVPILWFGMLLATAVVGTIIYDLIALRKGWRTVSRETLMLSNQYKSVAIIITAVVCFAFGALFGHLFLPQIVQ